MPGTQHAMPASQIRVANLMAVRLTRCILFIKSI